MNRLMKKVLAITCCIAFALPITACFTTDEEVSDEGQVLTLETLQDWCDESGTAFLNAFKVRDKYAMDEYIGSNYAAGFDDAFDEFFEVQARKVWLEDFYVRYLEGAQVISGTFLSDGSTVSMEYSVVVADYSTGNRNWLLLYSVTLYYGIDIENGRADILNPEVVFDLYRDMCNDYTTHVAATLLDVTDDFDISNYYYDEDLGVYIDRRAPEETEPTDESDVSDADVPVEETFADTIIDETEPVGE